MGKLFSDMEASHTKIQTAPGFRQDGTARAPCLSWCRVELPASAGFIPCRLTSVFQGLATAPQIGWVALPTLDVDVCLPRPRSLPNQSTWHSIGQDHWRGASWAPSLTNLKCRLHRWRDLLSGGCSRPLPYHNPSSAFYLVVVAASPASYLPHLPPAGKRRREAGRELQSTLHPTSPSHFVHPR